MQLLRTLSQLYPIDSKGMDPKLIPSKFPECLSQVQKHPFINPSQKRTIVQP